MRVTALLAAAVLATGGCNSQESQQAQPVQKISVRSAEQDALHKANELNRVIALKRAIYDSGYTCKRVTRSGYVGPYENLDMWMANCADGRDWAVFIGPDGSAQVRDCADVARFGLPKCEIRKESAG
jgi:hypothetical protein